MGLDYDQKRTDIGMAHACAYGGLGNPHDISVIQDAKSGTYIGTYASPDRMELD